MDRYDEMIVFLRVVEMRSFRKAAETLGIPASTASDVVKRTESRLKVKLLERTTRVVAPTPDGEQWYERCLRIVHELEDAEASFGLGQPEGRLRIDVHGTLARHFLMPKIPAFIAAYPKLELILSEGDRLVDLVREGIDCVVRVGVPADSDLAARRLGELREITVASPDYLGRHGTPRTLDELDGHHVVGFLSSATGRPMPLYFTIGQHEVERILPATLLTTGAETMVSAARLGLGIIQVPRYRLADDLMAGRLVEILADTPPSPSPVSVLYPRHRQLSPRVRAFLQWVGTIDFSN
ncbi:LysR family transcriptional regulator [Aurantimonas endophytica]|uniref:DNA-binding transcriptional LysR family regulator n=1 Tax=Aurantimonas endophytica TaxID=1522175 RepID=A0A7W6MQ40_9HYPH|nr:LysR family transcriptional regulator [Aurantimonas endophytica]MBB4003675.1 DNA-binding transcriptional LysR family regulator [Aurantimonas endophytica]MCO6404531.1 LysR family transcriptional regulator [Aurantimonas endophytica]